MIEVINPKTKVLAYIFRTIKDQKELLVFDHKDFDDVNPQVPAGTVEEGESNDEAILREVFEESGLKFESHDQYLGCFDFKREDLNEIHKRHVYSFQADGLPDSWEHIVSHGKGDKGLCFIFYWIPVDEAKAKLVAEMGNYL